MKRREDKRIVNYTEATVKQRGTCRQNLTIFQILVTALFVLVFGGCSTHTNRSADTATTPDSRLVDLGNGICQDTKTGKMWQVNSSKIIKSLEEAQNYAATLEEGGYHDWRLPMITELYDLYIIFDLHENGNCTLQAEGTYWSGEADLEDRVGTWELDDNCDPERQYIPKKKGMVRAIRP